MLALYGAWARVARKTPLLFLPAGYFPHASVVRVAGREEL